MLRRLIVIVLVAACATASARAETNASSGATYHFPDYDPAAEAAQEAKAKTRLTGSVSDLLSPNSDVRYFAYQGFVKERSKVISGLIAIVNNDSAGKSFEGPVHRAVSLLGEYRAEEAVPVLVERLTYLPPNPMLFHPEGSYESYYPCAWALSKIGQPAVAPLLAKISASDDTRTRNLALWVLMEIEGKDVVEYQMGALKSGTSDAARRGRCEAAGEYVRSYKPSYGVPYIKRAPWDVESGSH